MILTGVSSDSSEKMNSEKRDEGSRGQADPRGNRRMEGEEVEEERENLRVRKRRRMWGIEVLRGK